MQYGSVSAKNLEMCSSAASLICWVESSENIFFVVGFSKLFEPNIFGALLGCALLRGCLKSYER
ncbi:hypothetical protein A6V25_21935 [Nostoc sp. ATCC 53789]|nr:hypothetical protein A6V25_21935 [Nostoc sp. ATCC 53789]